MDLNTFTESFQEVKKRWAEHTDKQSRSKLHTQIRAVRLSLEVLKGPQPVILEYDLFENSTDEERQIAYEEMMSQLARLDEFIDSIKHDGSVTVHLGRIINQCVSGFWGPFGNANHTKWLLELYNEGYADLPTLAHMSDALLKNWKFRELNGELIKCMYVRCFPNKYVTFPNTHNFYTPSVFSWYPTVDDSESEQQSPIIRLLLHLVDDAIKCILPIPKKVYRSTEHNVNFSIGTIARDMKCVCEYFHECGFITKVDWVQCEEVLHHNTMGRIEGVVAQKIITEVQLSISPSYQLAQGLFTILQGKGELNVSFEN
jgi:hypothetical protein